MDKLISAAHSDRLRSLRRLISKPAALPNPLSRRRRRLHLPGGDHHLNPFYILWHYQILDPGSDLVAHWNHIFLITCLIALFIDPLYFFVPVEGDASCLATDNTLAVTITLFRSVADLFYLLHMAMKFRTAFIAPSSRVFGRGELVMDARQIAYRYLKSDFIIDLAATLPLPQVVIWLILPASKDPQSSTSNNTLALIVLIQYVPRIFVIFPLNRRILKTTGVIAHTAWAGAVYNLLLYILASHTLVWDFNSLLQQVLGASWYLVSISRLHSCWKQECNNEFSTCVSVYLDCQSAEQVDRQYWKNITKVISNCDANKHDIEFKFGMFADAMKNKVTTAPIVEKYFYCLWWGLKNLSSYGQTLETSTYVGETCFSILICIAGLILFAQLIGKMQTYLQSMTVRVEEWRVKRRDTEEWMRHRQLPLELQDRVRRFVQYKWLATRGVDEESILRSLPMDLRRDIQRHLCLNLVRRVPFFSQMDDQLLDAICERLVSSLCTQDTFIVREGDPVNEMLFIIRGQLESSTTNGGRSGFFNSITLRPGDFCGEELLTWALMPNTGLNLPSSTRTVKALCEVEAFALRAEDLKFVANQFRRLHSKKLQHAFRYYSHQWRTWGACFIQAAWRTHKKRELAKKLYMHEGLYNMSGNESDCRCKLVDAAYIDDKVEGSTVTSPNNVQHLGATILASKFAANTKRGVNQKVHLDDDVSSNLKMPKLFKPDEPDFSADREY